ncbi:MAG: enoyl-CoA hydratase/isomerase family protein [Dehalococcoidia bacterium]|nr:enoyl-CoA hydratase/isomerase family protein [Dehalococcoidia bacterium]
MTTAGFDTILYERRGAVAWVTLNRPKALNAYNVQMRDDLYATLELIATDDAVGVAVFRGAGERAFCAGADLTEFGSAPSQAIARQVRFERDVWARLLGMEKPLIAAIHGFCLGSGLEIALCCDLRIAAPDAVFGLPETQLGMIPAAGGTQTMPRMIGQARALEAMLTGRRMDAREALAGGIVTRVARRGGVFSTAERIAQRMAAMNPETMRSVKAAVYRGLEQPLAQGLAMEQALAARLVAASDAARRGGIG